MRFKCAWKTFVRLVTRNQLRLSAAELGVKFQEHVIFSGRKSVKAQSLRLLGMGPSRAQRLRPYKRFNYPPAIEPMTRKGSLPVAIASGRGLSGDSLDQSSWQT